MKKAKIITSNAELEEFLARTDIEIINVDIRSCAQSWFAQEYFTAVIYYDDEPKYEYSPDYWTRLEHQAAITAMGGMCGNTSYDETAWVDMAENAIRAARTLIGKLKEKEERK